MTEGADLAAIQRLLSDFTWAVDRGLATELAELFLPTATLTVNGLQLVGHEAIAQDCRRRFETPDRKTRHVWSNLRIDALPGGACAGTAVQMTFETAGAGKPASLRVNDVTDRFERDARNRWRFSSRTIERQMTMALPV